MSISASMAFCRLFAVCPVSQRIISSTSAYVAVAAWNDVDVGVQHRLPRGRAVVEADVEPVGLKLGQEQGTHPGHQLPNRRLLFLGQVEQAGDVSLREDQRVALG